MGSKYVCLCVCVCVFVWEQQENQWKVRSNPTSELNYREEGTQLDPCRKQNFSSLLHDICLQQDTD